MEVKVKEYVKYNGHSVKSSGVVDISFKAMYSELPNSIKLLQMLNNDVSIIVKKGNDKPIKLGIFRVKNVIIDSDGESVLKFASIADSVELDNINSIITSEEFIVLLKANIEEEEDNDE